jgi:hypothetical protein
MEIKVITNSEKRRGFVLAVSTALRGMLKLKKSKMNVHIYSIPKLSNVHKRQGAVARMSENKMHILFDSKLNAEKLVEVLAHEFVHIKQHARGQLRPYTRKDGKYGWYWMGKINRSKYENQPWEIEARKREKILGNAIIDIINAG